MQKDTRNHSEKDSKLQDFKTYETTFPLYFARQSYIKVAKRTNFSFRFS